MISKPTKDKTGLEISMTKEDAINLLWQRGNLSFLLKEHQIPVYDAIRDAIKESRLNPEAHNIYYVNCARQFGKTFIDCVIAFEECLRNPRTHIRFASPTQKELENSVEVSIGTILASCPPELKPTFTKDAYRFKNGSAVHLAGVNNKHEDNLRGSSSHLNIVDEAAFVDRLKYLIESVLDPQTITTDGLTLITSTPAVSPDHESKQYYDKCKVKGKLSEFTVYDNKSMSIARRESIKSEKSRTDWLREYEAQWVTDAELAIIPEWDDKYIDTLNKDEYYQFYHKYTAMDLGVNDLTAMLYATYNFKEGKLYIESEDVINGPELTTEKVSAMVKLKENKLWKDQEPYRRIADNNNKLMLQDLSHVYDLFFRPTNKDELTAMINKVRLFVNSGRLIVDPSCKQLIGCLKYGIWKKNIRQFDRSETYGHYDALAALVYLIRNLDENSNPIPIEKKYDMKSTFFPPGFEEEQNASEMLKNLFNGKF